MWCDTGHIVDFSGRENELPVYFWRWRGPLLFSGPGVSRIVGGIISDHDLDFRPQLLTPLLFLNQFPNIIPTQLIAQIFLQTGDSLRLGKSLWPNSP